MKRKIQIILAFIAMCLSAAGEMVIAVIPLLLTLKYSFGWLLLYFAVIPLMFVLALLREKMKEKIDEGDEDDHG